MIKNFLRIAVVFCLFVGFSISTYAVQFDEDYANKLKLLGVFQGTDAGFELEREPTRLEGLVIMLRLLGEEDAARRFVSPENYFEDVPEWGRPYVNYAYSKGITKGIGEKRFSPEVPLSAKAFLTYTLRAMGYKEGSESSDDFVWDQSELLALEKYIVDVEQLGSWSLRPFLRKDAVRVSYSALNANTKQNEVLAKVLMERGVFTKEKAIIAELKVAEEPKETPSTPSEIGNISNIKPNNPPQRPSNPSEKPEEVKPVFPEEKPYPLVGPATASKEQVYQWAKSKGMPQEGLDLVDLYFEISEKKGLNPVLQYAQMCHETGFLYIRGSLAGMDASYHNPCGLKVTEGGDGFVAASHKRFADWREGIEAHTDHTALYAGVSGYPKADTPDPRHFKYLKGRATMLSDLSGNWAPSWYYHRKIYKMVQEIEQINFIAGK